MRHIVAGCFAALCFGPVGAEESTSTLSVDQIIDRHIEARGGYASIKALRNLVYSGGNYEEGEYKSDGDATMSLGRPYFKLVGDKNRPGGYMEGYDGAAWEWFADPGIVVRTVGAASAAIRHYAGVEGPLLDYCAKGSTARYLGETKLDDWAVYVIELTRRDGFVEQFYIDQESFLILASGGAAPIHAFGEEVMSLTRIADYRTVAGLKIAHRFETVEMPSGKTLSSMQWGRIEANVELPADWFSPPEFERGPLQAFIEHLYLQRSDIDAVRWTYDEFRRAHPDIDTAEAVNVAGFQMLKMGQIDHAIALLSQNTLDYPESANVQFGLGRAYRTAGRDSEARKHFARALELDPSHRRAQSELATLAE